MARMIRINLLPVRQVKKRELGRQVLILFAAVLVLVGILNYIWYSHETDKRDRLATQIADTNRRIAELQKVIGEVDNINKRKAEVKSKLDVLEDLRKKRSGPVRMLDALATSTPEFVVLSDFAEEQNAVKLTGQAKSHDDVAEFMRGLGAIVWTPKGLGRLVERRRDGSSTRVELMGTEGAVEEFPSEKVGSFFTNIELKRAETDRGTRRVRFEIQMGANYAI